MPRLSFRLKLLGGMFLLVSGVSVAILLVTRHKVQAAYRTQFQKMFDQQINYFFEQREQRLSTIKSKCAELAASVRLRAAMEEGDPKDIYENIRNELMVVGRGGFPGPGNRPTNAPPRGSARALAGEFLRVLDAKGHVLPAGPEGPRKPGPPKHRRFDDLLDQLGQYLDKLGPQQVGYLAPATDDERVQLHEVVVTRISDPAGVALGALVFSAPMFDERLGDSEKILEGASDILSGIWLEGEEHVHSRTIPPPVRPILAAHLTAEARVSPEREETFVMSAGAEPFLVFHRALNPGSTFPRAHQVCVYSLAGVVATQRELRDAILGISAGILVCGAIVLLLLVNKLTLSLRELGAATQEVRAGNFNVSVPVRARDDIGNLVQSFNDMTAGLALKEKYRRFLNMFTDPKVAEEVLRSDIVLGGEQREVSVLFCDIRGFTGLTQHMAPPAVIQLLNDHMTALTPIVRAHHGVVDKFVGDLIMAVFGAPTSHGQDAARAAACALRIIAERARLNAGAPVPLQVGIGIATGNVVAGCMGSSDRVDYTVLGQRVNLASRLCGKAGPMEVIIDDVTCARLGAAAVVQALVPLALKGFDTPVSAWQLLELREPSPSAEASGSSAKTHA